MRIVLYGATGRAGSRILEEAVRRGHEVVAVTRDGRRAGSGGSVEWRTDDLSDVEGIEETTRGADAVISAYAPPATETEALVGVCERLAAGVVRAKVPRLLVVGGAGTLEVAPGKTLLESGMLPAEWVPIATAHGRALDALRASDADWTYVSPAAFFEPGERTGRYRTSADTLLTDEKGESRVSMEDYAIAMVDEVESGAHRKSRFAVAW